MNIDIPSDVMKILFGYGLLFIGGTMWVHGLLKHLAHLISTVLASVSREEEEKILKSWRRHFAICFLWIVPLGALLFVFGLAILGVDVLP